MRKLLLIILAVAVLTPGITLAQGGDPPQQAFLPFYYVNGMVLLPPGGPAMVNLTGRTVVFYHKDFPLFKLSATTNAAGEFSFNAYELYYFHNVPITFGTADYRIAVLPGGDGLGANESAVTLTIDSGFTSINPELAAGGGTWGSLYGKVTDTNANQLPNVTVTVVGTNPLRTGLTNAAGDYAINGIPAGNYSATAATPPPNALSATADNIDIIAGQATQRNITIASVPLSITTAALPDGTVGVDYSQTLAAAGGAGGYTWAISNGSLPPGLTLNGGTGVIGGTPTAIGSSTFNVTVTDSGGATFTAALSITVNGGVGDGPIINLTAQLEGFIGKPTTVRVEARGGAAASAAAATIGGVNNIIGTCTIALDANGVGTNNGNWDNGINPPPIPGGYFLVVRHRLGTGDGNHLPVILNGAAPLTAGAANIATVNLSTLPVYQTAAGVVPALKTLAGGNLALRAGYLNNDNIVDISDYSVWKGAVTPAGTIDQNNPNSVRSDLNGDNIIDISDYALWKGTVQDFTPGGVPQTGSHIYVP